MATRDGQRQERDHLTIGELARRTGLSTATLRMWETRHDFPPATRLPSGHRRYDESVVALVRQVQDSRDAGVRLEVAIADATSDPPSSPSVFAVLRRHAPEQPVHRLRKSTLVAISRAIEDESCARAQRASMFGAFQEERHFAASRGRWQELARTARSAWAFAAFRDDVAREGRLSLVPLASDAPMRREWAVVCDGPELPVVLTAWELPGQSGPDRDRLFEALWTVEPGAVRAAARVCARLGESAGVAGAETVLEDLMKPPQRHVDAAAAGRLFNRVVAYVDRSTA